MAKAKVECPCDGVISDECVKTTSPYDWKKVPKEVPRKGWKYVDYYDDGVYGNEKCSMCEHELRYVHRISHSTYIPKENGFPNPLKVGCNCANYLIAEQAASNNTGFTPNDRIHVSASLKENWKKNNKESGYKRKIKTNSCVAAKLKEKWPNLQKKIEIHYFTKTKTVAVSCKEFKKLEFINKKDTDALNTIATMAAKYATN